MSEEDDQPPPSYDTTAARLRSFFIKSICVCFLLGLFLSMIVQVAKPNLSEDGSGMWMIYPVVAVLAGFLISVIGYFVTLALGFARFGTRTLLVISGLFGLFGYLGYATRDFEHLGRLGIAFLFMGVLIVLVGQVAHRESDGGQHSKDKK